MPHQKNHGYLANPPSGPGSPVLVLHAWWGLNDAIRELCTRLAENGFTAYAPDLYHGKTADNIPDAERLSGEVFENLDQARSDLEEAVSFLKVQTDLAGKELAVIGFSLGAFFALDLSVSAPELVRSVVLFYGTKPGDYSRTKANYLGHFAENDEFESREDVDTLEQALKDAGRDVAIYQYKGTRHWFFEPDRPQAYNQSAAKLAWDRTLAFLNRR